MITVFGQYVPSFEEASHVLLAGPLDDVDWQVALQKIETIDANHITLTKSGRVERKIENGREYVEIGYTGRHDQVFRPDRQQVARARPFKSPGSQAIRLRSSLLQVEGDAK